MPKMRRTWKLWAGTTLALIIGVIPIYRSVSGAKSNLIHARRGPVVESVYGMGTVTANRTFQLKVGVTTNIRDLFVKEGDSVKAGAALLSLDDAGVQRAPFNGTVTAINYKSRETVFPQMPILSMADLHDVYVVVSLEQQGAIRVLRDQKALLSFESLRGQKAHGIVRAIFPTEGQFLVHIEVSDLPSGILPGMTADVAIEVARKQDALLVPVAAISAGQVIVLRDGHRKKTEIKVGSIDGQWAEVLSGDVREGEPLIVRAQ